MSNDITKRGDGHRTHLSSPLMRESLVSKDIASQSIGKKIVPIVPDCNFIAVGGHSIFDRGRDAILPLIDVLVKARQDHKFVVGVGGGARLRHTFDVCLDLGLPTGGLAMVAGAVDEQNQRMMWSLLAKHNGVSMNKENFLDLPLWLSQGMIPVVSCTPPYHFWEEPVGESRIPLNGQDVGIFLFAEVLAVKSLILVKDEDGLYTNDPKKDSKAEFIPKISAKELLETPFEDLIVERAMVECMLNAKSLKQVQIVNGLKPELVARALNGEHVGTIIEA